MGTNCPKCDIIHHIVEEVFRELGYVEGIDYVIKNVDEGDNAIEALTNQIAITPGFLIKGEPCFVGSTFTKEEFLNALK